MAISSHPLWVQAGQYTAQAERVGVFNTIFEAPGKLRNSDLAIKAQTTPNMTVKVGAGSAVISPVKSGFSTGFYIATNTSTYTLTIPAAHATYPRIDSVVIHAHDSEIVAGDTDNATIEVIKGVAAKDPKAPGFGNMTMKLAQIHVPAKATAITSSMIKTDMIRVAVPQREIFGPLFIVNKDWDVKTRVRTLDTQGRSVTKTQPLVYLDTRTGLIKQSTNGTNALNVGGVVLKSKAAKVGTNYSPTAGHTPMIQSGSIAVQTNSTGYFKIKYPATFPKGVSSVVAVVGGGSGTGYLSKHSSDGRSYSTWRAYKHGGKVDKKKRLRVEYIAIGW